ncbi:MAG TPA: ABC transporter substrate-binding protein [Chloroflexota bacterium]
MGGGPTRRVIAEHGRAWRAWGAAGRARRVGLAVALAACVVGGLVGGAVASPALAQRDRPVHFNAGIVALTAFEWPWFVVRDGPIGPRNTATMDIDVFDTDARAVQALVSSSVDVVETSLDAVARAVEQGADVVIVGSEVNRPTYALAVRDNVQSYADLRGRRIAVSDLVGGSTVVLRLMLQANGLSDQDVDLIPLGGTPNRYTALTAGATEGAILAQPADFRAQDEGYRLLDYTTARDYQFTVYAVRRSWAEQNRDQVVRFMRAMVDAHRWLHEPANRDQAVALAAQALRQTPELMGRTWDLYFGDNAGRIIPRDAELTADGSQTVLDVLIGEGQVRSGSTLSRYADDRYRQEALASR